MWERHPFIRRSVSYLLTGAGVLLLAQGARDVLESRWGQHTAAREFARQAEDLRPAVYQQPHAGDTIAKMIIPRLNVELFVVEGDDAADLRRGPGHLTGTAMPGGAGNCVIAGHRDTHFRALRDIRAGDLVILESGNRQFDYRVRRMQVVAPTNTSALRPGRGQLHLITCYPFSYIGAAPKRMVVEAQLTTELVTK